MATNELKWVRVKETYGGKDAPMCSTYRARVPGGWLVSVWAGRDPSGTYTAIDFHTWGGGVTFVSDPEHRWELDDHPKQ